MPHKKPIASETDARKMQSFARLGGLKEAPASIGGEYFTEKTLLKLSPLKESSKSVLSLTNIKIYCMIISRKCRYKGIFNEILSISGVFLKTFLLKNRDVGTLSRCTEMVGTCNGLGAVTSLFLFGFGVLKISFQGFLLFFFRHIQKILKESIKICRHQR